MRLSCNLFSKEMKNLKNSESNDGKIWWYEIFSVLTVCSSCISCGNFLGYTSSAVPSMQKDKITFPQALEYYHVALIGGLGPLGALLGAVLSVLPLKYLGPRRTIASGGLPLILASWMVISFSKNIVPVMLGRFLGGVGVGATIASAPLYVVELSSTSRRGKLGIMPQFLMISGILIVYILGAFLNWSNLALVLPCFTALGMLLIFFAPDNPKWLVSCGRDKDAINILKKIHGKQEADLRFQDIQQQYEKMESKGTIPSNAENGILKPILVCLGLISFQQLTGINGITFFAASIFDPSESSSSGFLPSIILAVTQLVASFMSTFFVERFGRVVLLQISTAVITLSGICLGVYFFCIEQESGTALFWIPLASLIVFAFGFAIGLGPVVWILVAEILPQEIRQVWNPLIIGFNWICVCVVTTSFPWLKESISYFGIFWMYAIIAAIGFLFVCFFIPETKGKSSKEIHEYFSSKK